MIAGSTLLLLLAIFLGLVGGIAKIALLGGFRMDKRWFEWGVRQALEEVAGNKINRKMIGYVYLICHFGVMGALTLSILGILGLIYWIGE